MKRLWQVIDREMRREGLTAKKMSSKLRMDPAHLSRLRTGQLRDLSAELLSHLLAGLGTTSELRTEILTAYLADKLEGGGSSPPQAAVKNAAGSTVSEEAPPYNQPPLPTIAEVGIRTGLNRRVAAALDHLAESALSSRRLQMLLISLAGYARKD